ncbi:MAG: LamB/YcsF family protein [Planctomycetota bacterium]
MTLPRYIDINADLGEGFGIYRVCDDEQLIRYITSANIACGFHAGDYNIMNKMVELSKKYNVAIGAHISLPDLQGFGRRRIYFSPDEIKNIFLYQLGSLYALAKNHNVKLQHIKLHGFLYHLANEDKKVAQTIADAIIKFDKNLIWIGFPQSYQQELAREYNIKFAPEGFADRGYDKNGKLLPRDRKGAIIKSPKKVSLQVLKLISHHDIKTICIHSDTKGALAIAKCVRKTLEKNNIHIKSLSNH